MKRGLLRIISTGLFSLLYLCTVGCSGGGSSTVTAPSGLSYSQATLTIVVGQAIPADIPAVVGSVASYMVSPALPAGLSLNTATGSITGIPTAISSLATYTVTATNSRGSTTVNLTVTVNPAAPSNLAYLAGTISGTVGQTVTSDTPTVTGSNLTFAASPALPAGLAINPSTGAISGTPTAVTSSAAYAVTATNVSGSTTASVTIAIAPAPPSSLEYPAATISGTAGHAIATDTPTISGSAATFTVSPVLPAGLTISSSTGTISGTPTHSAGQSSYTITATNAAGSTTAAVLIAILNQQIVVADLGQVGAIASLHLSQTRLLEQDRTISGSDPPSMHWALYNYASASKIVEGAQWINHTVTTLPQIDMANSIFVIDASTSATAQEIDIYSTMDGSALGKVTSSFNWWKLATDGSYIVLGSVSGLSIYSTNGTLLLSHPGNYQSGYPFAAPGQVEVAAGPAGANLVEIIPVSGLSATKTPSFNGPFQAWFNDGSRFMTLTGAVLTLYSNAGVQQSIVQLPQNLYNFPIAGSIGGTGNWLYVVLPTIDTSGPNVTLTSVLEIFAAGSTSPTYTATVGSGTTVTLQGSTLAVLGSSIQILDLSGLAPLPTSYPWPANASHGSVYGASAASQFVLGDVYGDILDGGSLNGTIRYFGIGSPASLAGSTSYAALANHRGMVEPIDAGSLKTLTTITTPQASSQVQLSATGSVLAAGRLKSDLVSSDSGAPLNILTFPGGVQQYTWPNVSTFTLSGSGALLAQSIALSTTTFNLETVAPTGGTVTTLLQNSGTALISPDDSTVAVVTGQNSSNVYKNGALVAAIQGVAIGWIDSGHLLVDLYTQGHNTTFLYSSSQIVSPTGAVLSTPALPALSSIQVVSSDQIYCPAANEIYSVSTGSTVWKPNDTATGLGTVAGGYVFYVSGNKLVAESY